MTQRSCLQPGRGQTMGRSSVIRAGVWKGWGLTSEELGSCGVLSNTPSARARSTACRASSSSCCSSCKRLPQLLAIPTCNRRGESLVTVSRGPATAETGSVVQGRQHWLAALINFHEHKTQSLAKQFQCHFLF